MGKPPVPNRFVVEIIIRGPPKSFKTQLQMIIADLLYDQYQIDVWQEVMFREGRKWLNNRDELLPMVVKSLQNNCCIMSRTETVTRKRR